MKRLVTWLWPLLLVALMALAQLGLHLAAPRDCEALGPLTGEELPEACTPTPERLSPATLTTAATLWTDDGDAPRALAALRAAQIFSPRDGALQDAAAELRLELGSPAPPPVRPAWARIMAPAELGWLTLLACAAFATLALRAYQRRTSWWAAAAAGTLAFGMLLSLQAGWADLRAHPPGVTLSTQSLRALPSHTSRGQQSMGRGVEVNLLQQQGSFSLVEDGLGRTGWVPTQQLAFFPRVQP